MKNVIDLLEERGLIDSQTSDSLNKHTEKPVAVYCGFDPTADSLHLGNMVALMGLAWFQKCGHTPVAIVGGATGMIGDPSGKKHERPHLSEEQVESNLRGIRGNIEQVLQGAVKPVILNNYDWYKGMDAVHFLREVGKYFRLGPMLGKESVRTRLESEEGMSFTEFSYQLLQGHDFLHLFENHGVSIQLGGSDQWGNITAGTDLIRKAKGKEAFGLTFPLLTTSDGKKFGKSEKGAIWLTKEKCSPFELYQYLVRSTDADVIQLMKMLTFMEMEEIRKYEALMQSADYEPNLAQKRLAEEVTKILHGEAGVEVAKKVTAGASPGSETTLDVETLEAIGKDMPNVSVGMDEILGMSLLDLLVRIELQKSKSRGRDLIRNGGLYVNNQRVDDEGAVVSEGQLIGGRFLLVASGKKNKILVNIQK